MKAKLLFDFTDSNCAQERVAIDDRVMGGVSQSSLRYVAPDHAVFEGVVSVERNGGFASVRSSPGERGLAGAKECRIEVRGAPKAYKLSLLTDDGFDSLNYQTSFTPSANGWRILSLPLVAFRASFHGREVAGSPELDPARVRQVGLMIAARQTGPFALELRRISLA